MDSISPTAILSAIKNLQKVIEDLPNVQKDVASAANSSAKEAAKSETEQSLIKVGLDPKGPSNPVQAVVDVKLQGIPPADTTPIVIPPEPCPSGLTLDPVTNKCVVASRGGAKKQTRKKRSKKSNRSRRSR